MDFLIKHKNWLFPALFILILTPYISLIDLYLARYFYNESHFQSTPLLYFFHNYAIIPGWIMSFVCLGIFGLSFIYSSWKSWRIFMLIPILSMIVGAWLIIDFALKDHWGRPRPRQVTEFGGIQEFRPYYYPNFFHQPEPSKSFPSGHCSMGFALFALAIMGKRLKNQRLFWTGMISAIILGIILSYTRIAEGGHFFSDAVYSGLIMWWTPLFFDWLIFQKLGIVNAIISDLPQSRGERRESAENI